MNCQLKPTAGSLGERGHWRRCSQCVSKGHIFGALRIDCVCLGLRHEHQRIFGSVQSGRLALLWVISNYSLLLALHFDDALGWQLLIAHSSIGLVNALVRGSEGRHDAAIVQPVDRVIEWTGAVLF